MNSETEKQNKIKGTVRKRGSSKKGYVLASNKTKAKIKWEDGSVSLENRKDLYKVF
jgi:hypothetical protein